MTENQNSNADGERPTPTPGNGQDSGTSSKSSTPGAAGQATNGADTPQSHDANDLDAAWAAFEAEHQADLHDVASSRQAKKFEKQAKKREKEALLSVDDLDIGSFTDDARPSRGGKKGKQSGPRDFTGSSWLDTDNVMDAYDDGGFTPPNPDLGPVKASTVLLTALLIIGLVGGDDIRPRLERDSSLGRAAQYSLRAGRHFGLGWIGGQNPQPQRPPR